jgi:hypothetical protein
MVAAVIAMFGTGVMFAALVSGGVAMAASAATLLWASAYAISVSLLVTAVATAIMRGTAPWPRRYAIVGFAAWLGAAAAIAGATGAPAGAAALATGAVLACCAARVCRDRALPELSEPLEPRPES